MRTDNVNGDIWNEVLENLTYDFEVSTQEDKIRRQTIARLALVSRSLSDCALDALWKGMKSLQPIAQVINSCASSKEDAALTYVEDSHWELRESLYSSVHSRVREYLRRIRFLFFGRVEKKEASLWIFLAGCMGQTGPLLPSLQRLGVCSIEDAHINYLTLLVPPTLNGVATIQDIDSPTRGFSSLYKLLRSRGCSLAGIVHYGTHSHELLLAFTCFTGLKSLILEKPTNPVSQKSTVPLPELLQSFPCLTKLQLDLRMTSIPNISNSPFLQLHALEILHITGHAEELEALLARAELPSLRSLRLAMRSNGFSAWGFLRDPAVSHFSALSNFSLVVLGAACLPLLMQDLAQLLSRQLTTFRLSSVAHNLTSEDLGVMITAWPNLRTLSLSPFRGAPFDATALLLLSRVPTLRQLSIRLDFQSLARPFGVDVAAPSKSSLEELHINEPDWFPSTLEEKLLIAKNILTLFPRLRTVTSKEKGRDVQDLAAIIKTINRTMAILSFRR